MPDRRGESLSLVLSLILSAVLTMAASWTHRFLKVCNSLPSILLLIVNSSPTCCDPERQRVAGILIRTPRCCLQRVESDVPEKLLALFRDEFLHMEATGQCDTTLYLCILQLRAALTENTMDIEGFNGWLQVLVNRARRTGQASADARLSIKFGIPIDATQCASMDRDIDDYMKTDAHRQRYVAVAGGAGCDIPAVFANAMCEHSTSEVFPSCLN